MPLSDEELEDIANVVGWDDSGVRSSSPGMLREIIGSLFADLKAWRKWARNEIVTHRCHCSYGACLTVTPLKLLGER